MASREDHKAGEFKPDNAPRIGIGHREVVCKK